MAHPSVPWQDAALSVATHKANVYIDLSGWSPKYFPPQLVRAANRLLKRQGAVRLRLPAAHPGPLARRLRGLGHQGRGAPLILKENAARLLGLARERGEEAP